MLGPLTIYSPLTFSCFGFCEPIRSPFFEPFPPLESAWRDHHNGPLVAFFFSTSFLPIFQTPLVISVYVPLRSFSVFNTFYIAGFIFSSSWWCLRSFLALTWYNCNIASLHLAASICTPHRPSSDYFTLFTCAIHSCHTANVSFIATIHSPRKEAHECSPLASFLVIINAPWLNTSSLPGH